MTAAPKRNDEAEMMTTRHLRVNQPCRLDQNHRAKLHQLERQHLFPSGNLRQQILPPQLLLQCLGRHLLLRLLHKFHRFPLDLHQHLQLLRLHQQLLLFLLGRLRHLRQHRHLLQLHHFNSGQQPHLRLLHQLQHLSRLGLLRRPPDLVRRHLHQLQWLLVPLRLQHLTLDLDLHLRLR